MRRWIGSLALAIALALPASALAETLRATSHAETGPGSLGETILEAGPGDTIELGRGEYPLTEGDTLLAQDNTIRGAGDGVTSVLPTGGGEAVSPANVEDATILPAAKGGGDGGAIETKTQIFAVLGTLAIFLLILELVRRRRLVERYALLWMAAGLALLVLSIWTDGLDVIADAMGVEEPANAIFILAFGVAFLLLLNFSVATSRLSEETKILAQETARLEQELRAARGEVPSPNGGSAAGVAEEAQHGGPVRAEDDA